MNGPDAFLLGTAVGWQSDHAQVMLEAGVESRAVGPSSDLSKNSATIEFVSSRLLVAVTIWDSGECEVIEASTDREQESEVQVSDSPTLLPCSPF